MEGIEVAGEILARACRRQALVSSVKVYFNKESGAFALAGDAGPTMRGG